MLYVSRQSLRYEAVSVRHTTMIVSLAVWMLCVSKIEKFKMLTKTHMGRRAMCQPSAQERYMYECHVAHYYLREIIPSFSAYRRYVSL